MGDNDRDRLRELVEEALEQTWAGGDAPVGPSISGAFQRNVGYAKDLARGVLDLGVALARVEQERDEAREALAQLRSVWNHHFETCEHPKIDVLVSTLPTPTMDDIRAWMNAPSNTASADVPAPEEDTP